MKPAAMSDKESSSRSTRRSSGRTATATSAAAACLVPGYRPIRDRSCRPWPPGCDRIFLHQPLLVLPQRYARRFVELLLAGARGPQGVNQHGNEENDEVDEAPGLGEL